MEFMDIKRAYLQAAVKRDIYVELPMEDREEGKCARQRKMPCTAPEMPLKVGKPRTASHMNNVVSR